MSSKHLDWKERKGLSIKDVDDFKDNLKIVYKKWQDTGFKDEWIRKLENSWSPCSNVWDFIKLLKAKKELSEVEYKCPICGGIAVANRYKHSARYHGLGSGCKTCGVSHS